MVTRRGGGCDVRCNLLARMVPGIGALVLAGCLSPRWGLLATNWPQLPSVTLSYPQLPSVILSYPQLPSVILSYPQLSSVTLSYPQLPSVILSYPQLHPARGLQSLGPSA